MEKNMIITLKTKYASKLSMKYTQWYEKMCSEGSCFIHEVKVQQIEGTFEEEPEKKRKPELVEEKKLYRERIKALGIDTKSKRFIHLAGELLDLIDSMYTKEQFENMAFAFYQHLTSHGGIPAVDKNDENFKVWLKTFKDGKGA
jgi:hypothetical protein